MFKSRSSAGKYVIASALVTSMALSPILSEGVFANADSKPVEQNVSSSPEETSVLDRGDRGQEVESLQTELEALGYYTYNLDGIFGPITEKAVKDFQAEQGLTVDGLAGPETLEALSSTSTNSVDVQSTSDTSASDDQASESEVVSIAQSLIGTPYVWGGTSPDGFDSSGFIQYVFGEVGVDLSRKESDMWNNDGVQVDSPSVGDVVFFEGTYDTEGASHSGIYIGDNKMIHAGSNGVEVTDLSIDYWQDHYLGVKSFK
ncbi:C40 family peptidase [Pseudalkalibacillus sp. A8]|uniref:C40 family peptidase n=1 Tax=Pseudalkalibacillus sp. A8 TaxID=3382641 RepID=UPI0038B6859C